MSRLAPLDRAMVLILVPLWVLCFGLAVRTQIQGGGVLWIGISLEDDRSYPALTGEYARPYPANPLTQAGLEANDVLLRAGDADLRGVGFPRFLWLARAEAKGQLRVTVAYERGGAPGVASIALWPVSTFLALLAVSLAFAASALLLLLRAKPTPTVRAYFRLGMCGSFAALVFFGSALEAAVWPWMAVIASTLLLPLALHFAYLFPDDRIPASRWHRVWPWCFAVYGVFVAFTMAGRYTLGDAGIITIGPAGGVALVALVTRKYRRGDPVTRRQLKWVLFGTYCGVLSLVLATVAMTLEPRLGWLFMPSAGAFVLVPISIVVSVVRFNLFDIDRLLSAATTYNIVLALLGAGALVVVPRLAEAASGLLGVDPGIGQVAFSLLLAGVVIPAQRRLRPQIDRLFFKERYALDHGIAELLPTLSDCVDARELTQRAGAGLHRLLRPEACVVYAGVEQSYAPVFVEGRAVPPAFEADSPLIGTLHGRRAPLALSDAGRRPDEAPLGPFDRAALETLGAQVAVPVQQGDALAAFLCLGPKRSGDVYTSTDLSLLAAVAEKVSTELRSFDQEEVIREGREMQESLRRYVPGAVAEQLASGAELAPGECEVSVLFVDIRGYTSFSESRRAEEIFSTVNRYTETVSQIVQKHGGSVVEFNGDGMMTVFGAPRDLAHKERAAVEAGREIVEAVAALPVEDAGAGPTPLSVGVGIATGEAFVGNIQAVDRMIWSAIGNTTNLAARLQSLTRDLDAAMVIDHRTWERAQAAATDFGKRPDVPIRGRRETQDLYVLAMPAPS